MRREIIFIDVKKDVILTKFKRNNISEFFAIKIYVYLGQLKINVHLDQLL